MDDKYIQIVASTDGGRYHYVDNWDDQPPTVRCDRTRVVNDLMYSLRMTHAEIAAKLLQGKIRLCQNCCKVRS